MPSRVTSPEVPSMVELAEALGIEPVTPPIKQSQQWAMRRLVVLCSGIFGPTETARLFGVTKQRVSVIRKKEAAKREASIETQLRESFGISLIRQGCDVGVAARACGLGRMNLYTAAHKLGLVGAQTDYKKRKGGEVAAKRSRASARAGEK